MCSPPLISGYIWKYVVMYAYTMVQEYPSCKLTLQVLCKLLFDGLAH